MSILFRPGCNSGPNISAMIDVLWRRATFSSSAVLLWAKIRAAVLRHARLVAAAALSTLVVGATVAFASWYLVQDERLGVVHFPISCGWQSQRDFTTATSLLHLFQFADAESIYQAIIKNISSALSAVGALQ